MIFTNAIKKIAHQLLKGDYFQNIERYYKNYELSTVLALPPAVLGKNCFNSSTFSVKPGVLVPALYLL